MSFPHNLGNGKWMENFRFKSPIGQFCGGHLLAGKTFPLLGLELVHRPLGGGDEARDHLHCRVCPRLK